MKIKVIKSSNGKFDGQVFDLVQIDSMVYEDKGKSIQVIDSWNELSILQDYAKETKQTRFYDMHTFVTEGATLVFIDEIELLNII